MISPIRRRRFLLLIAASVLFETCGAGIQKIGKIYPDLRGSQMNWVDKNGIFLLSNSSNFGLGFVSTGEDPSAFLFAIIHISSSQVVWSANRDSPVQNSDDFIFDRNGNALLQKGGKLVWSTDTAGAGASMELLDSGNLVMYDRNDSRFVWQSFRHPTDTLLMDQDFLQGMKLVSDGDAQSLRYVLEFVSGDVILYANYRTPQTYWSIMKENGRIINEEEDGSNLQSASMSVNSWRFYDRGRKLMWQFIFTDISSVNNTATAAAVLGPDGFITFYALQDGVTTAAPHAKIPVERCAAPKPCGQYFICLSGGNVCQCPSVLRSSDSCTTGNVSSSSCTRRRPPPAELQYLGANIDYFALDFVKPTSITAELQSCMSACLAKCSCLALFYNRNSRSCFLFDAIGSLRTSDSSGNLTSYIKLFQNSTAAAGHGRKSQIFYVAVIVTVALFVICGIFFIAYRCHMKKEIPEQRKDDDDDGDDGEGSEEDNNFLDSFSGMPIRFTYRDLQNATDNFSTKLGQGGFGSVYRGTLPDGTQLAVKKLEGIGQGKKEFRAEVSIIGSIHHIHLVKLKGFCAEGSHRLLAYEYMARGSLDKWIFAKNRNEEDSSLDWNTRFNVALGTAKGLAYLHEDCDSKIVHCDIKPENVLLDQNYTAKVSDFGLAKLMTREQSHVFTTLRGTRGYLAPEWITNYAISEKSDVYSYGMVLLEIIAGRKNFDPEEEEGSEKLHFPSYALKMSEQGNIRGIIDLNMNAEEDDDRVITAVKVALWCIQEEVQLRPSMSKVVQMLEGLFPVPQPPSSSPVGSRFISVFHRSTSAEGTSSSSTFDPSDSSHTRASAVRLSGPR